MKKNIILLAALASSTFAFSQVGIDTTEPKATLDVVAKPTDLTKPDGFIAPRLTGAELKAKDALYTETTPTVAGQTAAIVYITEPLLAADTTTKTVNVTTTGYYYFDGTVWQTMKAPEPWNIAGSNNPAMSNMQNIYQKGNVGVGKGIVLNANPPATLTVRDEITSAQSPFLGIGYGISNEYRSNAPGGKTGVFNTLSDNSTEGTGNLTGVHSSVNDQSTQPRGGNSGLFQYVYVGNKNNNNQSLSGVSAVLGVSASGGNYINNGNIAGVGSNTVINAISGSVTQNQVRTFNGLLRATAATGYTLNAAYITGIDASMEPTPSGGTIQMSDVIAVNGMFYPQGTGTITANRVVGVQSTAKFAGSSVKNIDSLYGMKIDKSQTGGAANITNVYGLFIQDYQFTGGNLANTYNLYSQGVNTKNYFEGKVGIGAGATAPVSNLKVTGLQNLADNAAALGAGLAIGDFYHTNGVVKVVY